MAVCEELEHAALAAIEQVIHCRVVPCLVSDRAMDRWLADESPRKAPRVLVFEKTSGAAEMARITSSYAGRLGADEVQIVRCGRYAWVRLNVAHKNSDLLFNLAAQARKTVPAPWANLRRWDERRVAGLLVDARQFTSVKRVAGELVR